ncbi:NusA-like transcription termination signal-binding factor [Candidatus Micrarchaeota archaeon]|nr:NusA-like transcription termination signal-binding factor [Candidatus Micrarchaeota archaeon]
MIELSAKDLSIITNFEKITRIMPSDYVETENFMIFLVPPNSLARSLGPKGANVPKISKMFKKKIIIIKDADTPEQFLKNFFLNIQVYGYEERDVMGENNILLTIDEKDRGIAIGKAGERIKAAKVFLKKKFNATVQIRTRRPNIYAEVDPSLYPSHAKSSDSSGSLETSEKSDDSSTDSTSSSDSVEEKSTDNSTDKATITLEDSAGIPPQS